jgi:hypothetical protein
MTDSPRWCGRCERYGDHHTDRCQVATTDVMAENRRLRAALEHIAGSKSGIWGTIAHEALQNPSAGATHSSPKESRP